MSTCIEWKHNEHGGHILASKVALYSRTSLQSVKADPSTTYRRINEAHADSRLSSYAAMPV